MMTDAPDRRRRLGLLRPDRRGRLITTLGLLVGAVAAGSLLATTGVAGGESPSPSLSTVSNTGVSPAPTPLPQDEQALGRFEHSSGAPMGDNSLLAIRGTRAYYRIGTGASCYATGPALRGEHTFGKMMCAADFPSSERPIMDFTVMHGTRRDGQITDLTVAISEGIAADGVASVGFRTAAGEIVATTPVQDNVYYHATPPSGTVTELVALGSDGKVLYSQPLPLG